MVWITFQKQHCQPCEHMGSVFVIWLGMSDVKEKPAGLWLFLCEPGCASLKHRTELYQWAVMQTKAKVTAEQTAEIFFWVCWSWDQDQC